MNRYSVFFEFDDYEVTTVVEAADQKEAIEKARDKLTSKGVDLSSSSVSAVDKLD